MAFYTSATNWIKKNKALFFLFLLGFVIRLHGINPGYYAHGDEIMFGQAIYMLFNRTLSMTGQMLGYPPLVAWMMLLSFIIFFIPLSFIIFFARNFQDLVLIFGGIIQNVDAGMVGFDRIFHNEIVGRYWVNAMYWGRYLTAVFGAGLIFLVYKLAVVYFKNKKAGIIGAFLTAVNYRLVLNSLVGLPDMFNAFFFLLALLYIGKLLNKPNLKKYILAWVTVALSFLVKFQIYTIAPLIFAHLAVSFRSGKKKFLKTFISRKVIIGGLVSLLIVVASMYYHFISWEKFMAINKYQTLKYGFGNNMLNLFPISYFYHVGIGPQISILGIIGIIFGFANRKTRLKTLILFSPLFILGYLYLYYTTGGIYTRNLIAIIPIFIIFASLLLSNAISTLFKNKKLSTLLLLMLTLLLAASNIKNSLVAVSVYGVESPRISAQKWIEDNLTGEFVYAAYSGTPIPKSKSSNVVALPPPGTAISYNELNAEGYDYVTLDFSVIHATYLWWMAQAPDRIKYFWNKPNDLLSQTYTALSTRELLWSHTLNAFLTPWQAPGYNYAIVDVNKKETPRDQEIIKNFSFDDNDWEPLFLMEEFGEQLQTSDVGVTDKSSLLIKKGGSLPGAIRWESAAIKIKPGHRYEVSGWLKSEKEIEKAKRAGFIRMDFYNEMPQKNILSRPIVSSVSQRYYGDGNWKKIIVSGIAPENATHLTVGFQIDSAYVDVYLDSVEISESKEFVGEDELRRFTVEDDNFFLPNNQGFI